ncbi:S4 domain-containing protein [Erythrobacter sp. NE805]|uniref:S4 domain-containing protein n=1 Tax=Erythrobacter sp. NE805 TaxID=3389875 RepID=UPI00396B1DEF
MSAAAAGGSIRIDRLLVYLRFARTRSAADALIAARAVRRNRQHVTRGSEGVRIGDVLTLALGSRVRVIELLALPARRGSPAEALSHYREVDGAPLDPKGQITIGASPVPGAGPPDPEDIS